MNINNNFLGKARVGLVSGLAVIAGLSMMIGAPKPASADSSFSFSISTDNFHIGYRSYGGDGGYRHWVPGGYDRFHHYRDGYFDGPVIYRPDYRDGHDYQPGYYGGDSHYRSDDQYGYRSERHDGDNNWTNGDRGYRGGGGQQYGGERQFGSQGNSGYGSGDRHNGESGSNNYSGGNRQYGGQGTSSYGGGDRQNGGSSSGGDNGGYRVGEH